MKNCLSVINLTKTYGRFEAVRGVSFDVRENEIFALIGPNGAGKSSTLRVISTILKPTSGEVYICGMSIQKEADRVRKVLSYLPEDSGAYKNLSGLDYLKFFASLYAENESELRKFIDYGCHISGLSDKLNEKIGTYSKGMTRKLLLARAIMTKPKLAILDEPTSGLDVINAIEIREVLKTLASEGMSILVSSHNMLEIEFLCDRVAIIDKGFIHCTGTPAELKEKYRKPNLEEVFAEAVK